MMYRFKGLIHLSLIMLICFTAGNVFAARPRCSVCDRKIKGRYLKNNSGKLFCSRKCFDTTLPKCHNCRRPCQGRYLQGDGKIFCSQKCADEMMLPKCAHCRTSFREGRTVPTIYGQFNYCMKCFNGPKCFVCERPDRKLEKFRDGRLQCPQCARDAVTSLPEVRKIFRQVQNLLVRKLNFRKDHPITLRFLAVKPSERTQWGEAREFGLYSYQGKIIYSTPPAWAIWQEQKTTVRREDEKCVIYVLSHLPRRKLAEVIAHELSHDYMQHRWPYIKDELIKEGFAEAVAAEYNRLTDNEKWNFRMEQNPDPVYGRGYRLVRKWQLHGGWPEVARRLTAENKRQRPDELK